MGHVQPKSRIMSQKRSPKKVTSQAGVPSKDDVQALIALFNQKRYVEGESLARKLTQRFPNHGFGWKVLGAMLKLQGRLEEALLPMQKASALTPMDEEAHRNLGSLLVIDLGRVAESEESCRRLLKLRPNSADAHNNLGFALQAQGRLVEAENCYLSALANNPGDVVAFNNLGNVMKSLGRFPEAEDYFRRALANNPGSARMHNNLGTVFLEQCRFVEAEESFQKALALAAPSPEGGEDISPAFVRDRQRDYVEACNNLGNTALRSGRLSEAENYLRRAIAVDPTYKDAYGNFLFALNYSLRHTPEECLEAARAYGRMLNQKVPARFTSWNCSPNPERLRVGFVSGDLRNHPVGFFVEGLLSHIDPNCIELYAYPTFSGTDELTARIRHRFAGWRPLIGQTDETAARMIHGDGIHVLVDLSGHSACNRFPVFAWKPAPVQVCWPGYFATTGLPEMDYFLADETGVPEAARTHFTETVWYLPDTRLCFTAPAFDLPVSPLPALTTGAITFGCFQNYTKINDDVLATWAEILSVLPFVRLRIQCPQLGDTGVRVTLEQRLHQRGIDSARIDMHGVSDRRDYLLAHGEVDILLDTFPFPGGTTTCEALWMGVPTLTLSGETMLARQGVSLMTAAGLPEWVAESRIDYVQKAVALSGDLPMLANLRAKLRQRVLVSPLFDAPRFAGHFQVALRGMFSRWENQERSM